MKNKPLSKKKEKTLRSLILWREAKAQEHDLPRSHFLDDKTLIGLVYYLHNHKANKIYDDIYQKYSDDFKEIVEKIKA